MSFHGVMVHLSSVLKRSSVSVMCPFNTMYPLTPERHSACFPVLTITNKVIIHVCVTVFV